MHKIGAAALVLVALVLGGCGEGPAGRVTDKFEGAGSVAVGGGEVWALDLEQDTLRRIDPQTGEFVGEEIALSRLGVDPRLRVRSRLVAAEPGAVWVRGDDETDETSDAAGDAVRRIDTATGRVTVSVPVHLRALVPPVAVGEGGVWAPARAGLTRFNPQTGREVARFPSVTATGLAVGEGAVWGVEEDGEVVRIDPRTNTVEMGATVADGGANVFYIAAGEGAVWVARAAGHTVSRIDPQTRQVTARIEVGNGIADLAAGGGALWVSLSVSRSGVRPRPGVLRRIDPDTDQVGESVYVGGGDIAIGEGALWVANPDENTMVRVQPHD